MAVGRDDDMNRQSLTNPLVLVELFVVVNLAFLALDIYVAHSINQFAHWAEWIPFVFSLVSPVVLAVGLMMGGVANVASPAERHDAGHPTRARSAVLGRRITLAVGVCSVLVGVAGMLLHLESQFFARATLKNLVYTAPFVAPLAYTGLGFLLIMSRMVRSDTAQWAGWVVFLAWGGFVGNFVLALADHAQNGFFYTAEWIPVFASAAAVGALVPPLLVQIDRTYLRMCLGVMAAQVIVGVIGFALHVMSNLERPGGSLYEQFLYGAPVFAPLLMPNLAILAALGLWALSRHPTQVAAARSA